MLPVLPVSQCPTAAQPPPPKAQAQRIRDGHAILFLALAALAVVFTGPVVLLSGSRPLMDRVASGMKQLNSKVLARPTVRAQPDRRAIPLASSEDLGRMLRRNREATAAFRRGTPTRTSPVSRRRQLEGLAGLGLFAVGASDKAKAADAGLKVDSGLSNFVRASPESEEMPAVSTLRSARRSLKGMRAALRQRQFERDRYLKGAPATIVATGSHVLAGFGAGCMSTIVLHPIDTVKTRLQKGADNITDAIAQGNLYNGIISNLMKEAPNSAIYMTVVEAIQNVLLTAIPNAKLLALFLAGGLGDLIGSICRVPAEMLNKRLQTGMSPDIFDAIQKTFFTEEGRQLTKETWGVVVMRDVPHGAVQYMIFLGAHAPIAALLAAILPALNDAANGGSGNFILDAVPGAVAGAIAAYGTTPADVMVTNFATYQSAELAKDAELEVEPVDTLEEEHTETTPVKDGVDTHVEGERPSLARIGAEIYKKEGIQGFFVGGLQRIVYYGPMTGVFFGLYESLDRTIYPKLLPGLTNPFLINFGPELARFVEGNAQKAVDATIAATSMAEKMITHH